MLEFDGEYIDFTCRSELVQSLFIASGKKKMCLGVKKTDSDSMQFLCDDMDKEENIRLYPDDELVLAVY